MWNVTLYFILIYFLIDKFSHCLEPAFCFSQLVAQFRITDIRSHAFEDVSTLAFQCILNFFNTTTNLHRKLYRFLRHFMIANVTLLHSAIIYSRAFVGFTHYILETCQLYVFTSCKVDSCLEEPRILVI